jgi:hypothetical protein
MTPPLWSIDSLFRAEDRLDLFGVFHKEMKSHPNDVILRAAGVSLYWLLSRFCPQYEEQGGFLGVETGDYAETIVLVSDYSEEWEPYRREFQGYLAQLVRLVNLQDCVDWPRTLWEIRNCCAARDWDLARKLFAHAAKHNQCPAPELSARRAHFEYRVIFGPDIDSNLRLGWEVQPKWDVQPYWEWVREEFSLLYELSLEALAVPFDYLWNEAVPPSESRTGNTAQVEFIWGALQDKLPLLPSAQTNSLRSAISALEKVLDKLGPRQDFYRSILAQCLEFIDLAGAAEAYGTLALRPEQFEGLRSRPLFALKAAKLYLKNGETGKAEKFLESVRNSDPDHIWTLQELVKLKVARGGDLRDADGLAKHVRTFTKEKDWTPAIRLFMSMHPPIVLQAAVDKEVAKRAYYPGLCAFAKEALETAVQHEWSADENQKMRDRNLRIEATCYAQVVEFELKDKIFQPFRMRILDSGQTDQLADQRGNRDEKLDSYVYQGRELTFGEMIGAIKFVPMVNYVQKKCRRLRASAILEKWKQEMRQLNSLRRPAVHGSLNPQLAAQARELAESVIEAMN